MNLLVEVNGQQVPLDECGWLMRRACGCIVAASCADQGDLVLATAEQCHKHLRPRKDSRERDLRNGVTFELITMAHYREHIGAKWECAEHARAEVAQ